MVTVAGAIAGLLAGIGVVVFVAGFIRAPERPRPARTIAWRDWWWRAALALVAGGVC